LILNSIKLIQITTYFLVVYIPNIGDKVSIKDLHEIKKKVIELNNSKILGEIISQKSIYLVIIDGQFVINNPMTSSKLHCMDKNNLDRLWLVLQKNELRHIEEGDILKLGRVRLKVDIVDCFN
jgi:hypothetical protein